MPDAKYDREASEILRKLPRGPRIAIIGSTEFWHEDSQQTCEALGELLAGLSDIVILTGGVEGIGETVGRRFSVASARLGHSAKIFHVLPRGEATWDYGETLFAGDDMEQRREILGRLANIYIVIEGGPGTVHEARVARARCAPVIPIGRSGGFAGGLYSELERPEFASENAWVRLGATATPPKDAARATFEIAAGFLEWARQDLAG